jgi:HEAT repeat protein
MASVINNYKSPALKDCLRQIENPETRLEGLKRINTVASGRVAYTIVSPYLNDPDSFTVALAARAAGKSRQDSAVDPLIDLLSRRSEIEIIQYAIYALGELKPRRAVKALGAALDHHSSMIVASAAQVLGAIGDPEALPLLQRRIEREAELRRTSTKKKNPALLQALKDARLAIAAGKSAALPSAAAIAPRASRLSSPFIEARP